MKYVHIGDIDKYLETCSLVERKIALLFLQFKDVLYIKIANEQIAELTGCSTRSVTRALRKFVEDKFLLRQQKAKYARSVYRVNILDKNYLH